MNVLDIVILVLILLGAYKGWKYGCFSSAISLLGTLFVFVAGYYIKNPLSVLMYENMPFNNYGGIFKGVTSFNILVYEAISYIIVLIVLTIVLKVIIKLTGVVDKLLNLTIIFALPSKILGFIIGGLQYFIYGFAIVFVLAQIPATATYVNDSNYALPVLENTPLLSNVTNGIYHSVTEIFDVCTDFKEEESKQEADYKSLEILMSYDVVSSKSVEKLKEKGKLKIDNIDVLIDKYKDDKKL